MTDWSTSLGSTNILTGQATRGKAGFGGSVDVRPTGDLEVVGSIPAGSSTFFRGDLIMKYFSTDILSLLLIKEGHLSVSGEGMCTILDNRLED